MRVLARLEARYTEAVAPATNAPRLRVNRNALARDVTFLRVVDRLSFLKRVRLERFRDDTSKAGFPDAHLAGVPDQRVQRVRARVALTTVGVPASVRARDVLQTRVGVRFRDGFYSLDDIEHGLLRGNAETVVNSLGGLLGARARSRQIPTATREPRTSCGGTRRARRRGRGKKQKTKTKTPRFEVRIPRFETATTFTARQTRACTSR